MVGNRAGSEALREPSCVWAGGPAGPDSHCQSVAGSRFPGAAGWLCFGSVLLPFLFVLATELWAIKILDRTGITGIQVSCAITGLWNGAACVSLVLRNRPSFGCERLSAQGQATRSEREKNTQQSSK